MKCQLVLLCRTLAVLMTLTGRLATISSFTNSERVTPTVLFRSLRQVTHHKRPDETKIVRCHASRSHFGGRFAPLGL